MQSKERKEEKEEGSDRDNRELKKKKGQVDTVGMETCVDDICHYSSLHSR